MPLPRSAYWSARAQEYTRLTAESATPEVRKALAHLASICSDLAKAADDRTQLGRADLKVVAAADVMREQTSRRWRIRETEYRQIASTCETEAGCAGWLAIAERCAAMAQYLESTGE